MSAFVANGSSTPSVEITSGGWWPAVSPDHVRDDMRLDGSITAPRLRSALVNAISTVNDALAGWQAAQAKAGVASLADVPAPVIDGKSRLMQLYFRAVATYAAAELTERYRSYDATDSANQRADDLSPSIDELRRDHRWAIRDFLGQRRVTVDLI